MQHGAEGLAAIGERYRVGSCSHFIAGDVENEGPSQAQTKGRALGGTRLKRARQGSGSKEAPSATRSKLLTPEAIEEIFRRFAAANPEPKSELEYRDPFTLLVAVVLSAQATDAGVNKATRPLFKIADTPEKMVRLGEAKLRDYIKTIGLYRNKARNVIELSRRLIADARRQRCRATATRSRRCRASAARPPTWF